MAKKLNYQVGFTADTSSLQAALDKAVQSLQKLGSQPQLQVTSQLQEASSAALDLSNHLTRAFNQETGKLDLITFNNSLKQSNTSLEQYANTLISLGPAGEQAFLNVAQAISKAELPLKRSNKLLDELWTTMKNTARWQLTSSALHGFMGAVSTAYGYTKDLNSSLNNIQIVTEKNNESMAEFAENANKAAKALSTTTTNYTDASLIYYQQGLDDEQVQGRTDVTVKLANAAGESAQTASEQLTAIWNNFYDGSKSLEYYADVMTALGASTASSTQEISAGLQKFAAIADTVGLSYEYAASALATITATTRESADVVGTSLRTLFARVQGLLQDEEQDDGTTLNKYSKALAKVGIDIKTTSGELKGMDQLLDEMAARWTTLSDAQQMALAQTVAGVRQYTQLVALMENYEFFQENLTTAMGAEGSLEKQAEIYASSWEAARQRVRASAEDIYDSLINEDFFIGFDNIVAGLMSGIADVIDGLGGMQGVLAVVALAMNKVYGDKIAQSMRDMAINIGIISGAESKRARELQAQAATIAENLTSSLAANDAQTIKIDLLRQEIVLQGTINENMDALDVTQREWIQNEQVKLDLLKQEAMQSSENIGKLLTSTSEKQSTILASVDLEDGWQEKLKKKITALNKGHGLLGTGKGIRIAIDESDFDTTLRNMVNQLEELSKKSTRISSLTTAFDKLNDSEKQNVDTVRELLTTFGETVSADADIDELTAYMADLREEGRTAAIHVSELGQLLRTLGADKTTVASYIADLKALEIQLQNGEISQAKYDAEVERLVNTIKTGAVPTIKDWASTLVSVGTQIGQLSMGINSFRTISRVMFDDSLDGTEKFVQSITAISMLIPFVSSLVKTFGEVNGLAGIKSSFAALGASMFGTAATGAGAAAGGATPAVLSFGAALQAALGPIMLIVSVATMVGVAIAQIVSAIDKENEAQIQKAKDAHEAVQQEIQDNYDLIDSYKELLKNYEDTGDGKAELSAKATELAEALGLEGAAVANLTGDYSELNEQVDESLKKLNAQALQDNLNSQGLYGDDFVKAMRTGVGHSSFFNGGKYTGDLGTSVFVGAEREAFESSDFAKEYASISNKYINTAGGGQQWSGKANVSFSADDIDPKTLIDMYEKAQEAVSEMRQAQLETGQEASEIYDNLVDWLNKSKDSYEAYANILSEIEGQSFQDAVYNTPIKPETIQSYEEYLNYYEALNAEVDKRVAKGEIEADNVDKLVLAYMSGEESLKRFVVQQRLTQDLADKFGTDISQSKAAMSAMDTLKDEDLQMILKIVPQVSSVEEFQIELERILQESVGEAARDSMNIMGELVQELNSNLHISDDNYETLMGDTHFLDTVKAEFESFDNFRRLSEQQQIEYIRDYYTAVSAFASENLDEQRKNTEAQINIVNAQYQALSALTREANEDEASQAAQLLEEMASLRQQYTETSSEEEKATLKNAWVELEEELRDYTGFKVSFDIEDAEESLDGLTNELDALAERLDDIFQKEIEIAIDWSDFDDLKGQFDALADFAVVMQDEAAKVGDSYQYPIDAIREWMDVYPELFAQATVNTNGLIELNQAEVDDFIQGKKDETDINAEAKIAQWEQEKAHLEVIKTSLLAEATAYREKEQGKLDISAMSAEQIALLDQQLTEYQMQNGIDEATAHKNVLEAMGLNEEEFGNIVAQVSETNAKNTVDSTQEGASKGASILQKFSDAWKAVGHNVLEVAKTIGAALTGEEYTPNFESVFNIGSTTSSYKGAEVNADFKGVDIDPQVLIEQFKADQLKQLDLNLSQIDNAIANIDAKILAARNLELTDPREGSRGPSSGSGKSGSASKDDTGKQYTAEEEKKLEDIEDRYHEITREILRQNDILDDISNDLDRTYGVHRFKNFTKQLAALEKQAENYATKLDEAQNRYLPQDTATLKLLFDNVTIKDNGELANYEDLLNQTINNYNVFLAKYNAFLAEYSALTKTEQEARQEDYEYWQYQLKAAEAAFDARKAALKQYEDTRDVIQELKDNIEDTRREIADNKLQQVEYRLEIVLDVKSMRDALRDFDKSVAEIFNDALTHGLPVAKLEADQAKAEADMYPEYAQQYQDLLALYNSGDEFMDREQIIQDIVDLQGKVLDSAEAIVDWANSIEDIIPAAVDAARERFELFTDQLDHNTSVLETIKELYALQGVTYKTLDGFGRLQGVAQERLDAQVAQAQLQKAWYDEARQNLVEAQAALDSLGGNENDLRYDTYKKARDAYLAEFNEAQEAYLSLAKDAMETAQDMYLEQIEKAVYDFGQVVSKGVGLDLLQDKYDHYIEKDERYFDKVNEAYQTAAWYNKLQEDIDKATDAKTKQRLKELQEEIDMRREGNKLSQYDLDILNAKYEVLQAQMALEDAQNAKNQVKLVRDRQGNWNYQYTADPNQVDDAQNNLLDAENDWYNIAKKQVTDVTGEIVSTWQECQDKIQEIYSDMTLTDQERSDRAQEIYQYYTEKIKYLEEEKQQAILDMTAAGNVSLVTSAETLGKDLTDFTDLTADEIKNIIDTYGDDILDLITADNDKMRDLINTGSELIQLFENSYSKELDEMTTSSMDFEDVLRNTLDQADADFLKFQDTVQSVANSTGTSLWELDNTTNELSNSTDRLRDSGLDAASSLWNMIDAAQTAAFSYADMAQSVWGTVEALRALAAAQANFVASQAGVGSGGTALSNPNIEDYSYEMLQLYKQGMENNGNVDWATMAQLAADRNIKINDNGMSGISSTDAIYQTILQAANGNKNAQDALNEISGSNYFTSDWEEKWRKIIGFDTGGYTGVFDDERLAFLHEKELVLNQKDTENILAAVNVVRDFSDGVFSAIAKMLDNNATAAMALMGDKIGSAPVATPSRETIEQQVYIEAHFEDATTASEIQEALSSIVNDAAQWAQRRQD